MSEKMVGIGLVIAIRQLFGVRRQATALQGGAPL